MCELRNSNELLARDSKGRMVKFNHTHDPCVNRNPKP